MKGSEITVDNTQALDPEIGLRDLSVKFAKASDCRVYKSSWMEKFGEWKHVYCISDLNRGGSVRWTIDVKTPGIYQIALKVRGEGRPVWKVETGEGKQVQNQQSAPSAFLDRPIGWLRFDQPGKQMITVCMPDGGKADLASISIIPVQFE